MKSKLKASTIEIKDLKKSDINTLFELFQVYYENIEESQFKSDLIDKDKIILLRDHVSKKIKGFSTIKIIEKKILGKTVIGLFSGDTIIDDGYWGQTALTMEFFKNLMKTKMKNLNKEFYWFLISKGFKTYLLLSKNFKTYYPRFNEKTPTRFKTIINDFSAELFGDEYDEEKGLLIHKKKKDYLKGAVAPIGVKELKVPEIKFFSERNPEWERGDELCCIGRVDLGLITKYLSRTFYKMFKNFHIFLLLIVLCSCTQSGDKIFEQEKKNLHSLMIAKNKKMQEKILDEKFSFESLEVAYVQTGKKYYSWFGHVFLRFVGSAKEGKNDLAVSFIGDFYDVNVDTLKAYYGNKYPVLSVIKTFEGFVDEYTVKENRSIYRHSINIGDEKKARIIKGLRNWIVNLEQAGFYGFRRNGCTVLLLRLLNFGFSEIDESKQLFPIEVITYLKEKKIITLSQPEINFHNYKKELENL